MEKDVDINKVIDKVRKLLAKADKRSNDNDAECQSAALMAQRIMAEYSIEMTDVSDIVQKQPIVSIATATKWNMGFRKPLAHIIADNFRCKVLINGDTKAIIFVGTHLDTMIAKETYEYIYDFVLTAANRQYSKALASGRQTKGVFNSYATGFLQGLTIKFEEQCRALVIVRPPEVDDYIANLDLKKKKSTFDARNTDRYAFSEGMHDGSTIMGSKGRLE